MIQKTSVVPVRCPVNLYGSDQVRDQLEGEIIDHCLPLGLLVLCGRQARLLSVCFHHRHALHEAALIMINFQVTTTFQLSQLQTAIRGGLTPDYQRVCMCNLMCVAG